MVPRVASRGHSFKGAGQYYLHDKDAQTSERVAWTQTHNLPSDDPDRAIKYMAFTAMHSSDLKKASGIAPTGRKSTQGPVYSFSLAWHPDQKPEAEHMQECALDTMKLLGLEQHEALMVAHNETDHEHVHVIVNLVHPDTGKIAKLHKDYLKLSQWAESYENEYGQIYCPERVENNKARTLKENQNIIIKHKEEKLRRAQMIEELYQRADSGKAFQAALKQEGYDLAKGDRRGFVLVDEHGKIHSLSRQLKGQRAKDIRNRLSDISQDKLRSAKEVANEKKYFDRDRYEADWQKSITEEAIESNKVKGGSKKEKPVKKPLSSKIKREYQVSNKDYREYLDRDRLLSIEASSQRGKAKKELDEFYVDSARSLDNNLARLRAEIKKKKGSSKGLRDLKEKFRLAQKSFDDYRRKYQTQLDSRYKKIDDELMRKRNGLRREYNLPINDNQNRSLKSGREPDRRLDQKKRSGPELDI